MSRVWPTLKSSTAKEQNRTSQCRRGRIELPSQVKYHALEFCGDWMFGSEDMLVVRQTHRHAHHTTLLHYRDRVTTMAATSHLVFVHVGVLRVNWARSEPTIADMQRQRLFGLDRLVVVGVKPPDNKVHDRHLLLV